MCIRVKLFCEIVLWDMISKTSLNICKMFGDLYGLALLHVRINQDYSPLFSVVMVYVV